MIEDLVMDKSGRRRYWAIQRHPCAPEAISIYNNGCNLECIYCWNSIRNDSKRISRYGRLMSPGEVADKVNELLRKWRLNVVRVSGGEAILGFDSTHHLAKVIEYTDCWKFVIETNGIELGRNQTLFSLFESLKDKVVFRINIKGSDYDNFERNTLRPGHWLDYAFKAIETAKKMGFKIICACMEEVVDVDKIEKKLIQLGVDTSKKFDKKGRIKYGRFEHEFEVEHIKIKYSWTEEKLRKVWGSAGDPKCI